MFVIVEEWFSNLFQSWKKTGSLTGTKGNTSKLSLVTLKVPFNMLLSCMSVFLNESFLISEGFKMI